MRFYRMEGVQDYRTPIETSEQSGQRAKDKEPVRKKNVPLFVVVHLVWHYLAYIRIVYIFYKLSVLMAEHKQNGGI